MQVVVSHTTRPRRKNEEDGIHYHFITRTEFRNLQTGGEFVDAREIFSNLYGIASSKIEEILSQGLDAISDLDVEGALALQERYEETLTIMLLPPNMEELERRLQNRGGMDASDAKRRMDSARLELLKARQFKHSIILRDIHDGVAQVQKLLGLTQ